jgi:hypothetical protein
MAWNTTKKPRHDHDLGPMNSLKSPTCPRCIQNREENGIEIHTCDHGGAFGRRDLTCLRCRQLAEGVNVETALGKNLAYKKRNDEIDRRSHEAHRRHCPTCEAGQVCTFGEW